MTKQDILTLLQTIKNLVDIEDDSKCGVIWVTVLSEPEYDEQHEEMLDRIYTTLKNECVEYAEYDATSFMFDDVEVFWDSEDNDF